MAIATNGDCELYYDTFGDPTDPTLLLVNGLGSQCINYRDEWCQMFAGRGFHVVRFDNRDVGLSTSFEDAPLDAEGRPTGCRTWHETASPCSTRVGVERRPRDGAVDGRDDRADDGHRAPGPAAVDDVGDVGDRRAGVRPAERTEAWALLTAPPPTDRESYVEQWVEGLRVWGSPAYADEDRWRADAERAFDRSFTPSGTTRQFLAVRASGSRASSCRT